MLVVEGGLLMAGNSLAAGGRWGRQLIDRVPLLRPDEQLVTAVLSGWRNQQLVWNPELLTWRSSDFSVLLLDLVFRRVVAWCLALAMR